MNRVYLHHEFGPFYRPDSRILILGSFPSVKSREAAFFYGHPQNRFWRVLAALFDDSAPECREDKERFLEKHHIALYDVIESCSIIGSSDSSIEDVEPADLSPILAAAQIDGRIYANGAKAHMLYQKLLFPKLHRPACRLPSTSPANAACSLESLIEQWRVILNDSDVEMRGEIE